MDGGGRGNLVRDTHFWLEKDKKRERRREWAGKGKAGRAKGQGKCRTRCTEPAPGGELRTKNRKIVGDMKERANEKTSVDSADREEYGTVDLVDSVGGISATAKALQ